MVHEVTVLEQEVIYFTEGMLPTAQERAEIAELNGAARRGLTVFVRSAAASSLYGHGNEPCSYVAGSPPVAYAAVPTITPLDAARGHKFDVMTQAQYDALATKQDDVLYVITEEPATIDEDVKARGLFFVRLSQNEYDALPSRIPNFLYLITG